MICTCGSGGGFVRENCAALSAAITAAQTYRRELIEYAARGARRALREWQNGPAYAAAEAARRHERDARDLTLRAHWLERAGAGREKVTK